MQDELLIKFIDGKCSQEESEIVIRELSLEGENSMEWLQMQAASSLAGTKPLKTIQTADAREFVSKVIDKDNNASARRKMMKWSGIAAGLCAMAASIAIILTVGRTGDGPGLPEAENRLAVAKDSLEFTAEQPKPEISTKGTPQAEVHPPVPQPVTSIDYDSHASQSEAPDTAKIPTAADRGLKMIRPSKSPYRVKVLNLSKDFVFEWETTEAVKASLVVKDRDGMAIVEKNIADLTENHIPVSVMPLTDRGELIWNLVLVYSDGSTVARTGRLELISAKE